MRQRRIMLFAAHKEMRRNVMCAFLWILAVISVYNKNKGGVDGADKQFFFHRLKEVTEGMEKDALHIVQQMLLNFWESDESFAVPSGGYLWVTFELS